MANPPVLMGDCSGRQRWQGGKRTKRSSPFSRLLQLFKYTSTDERLFSGFLRPGLSWWLPSHCSASVNRRPAILPSLPADGTAPLAHHPLPGHSASPWPNRALSGLAAHPAHQKISRPSPLSFYRNPGINLFPPTINRVQPATPVIIYYSAKQPD